MNPTNISPEIRRFILTSIPSVPHLEALLLLRNEADVAWSAAMLAQRLYLSEKVAVNLLIELVGFGVVVDASKGSSQYRYQPRSDELRARIDQWAAEYSANLLEVTHLIHSKTDRKAHQFAEAFRLRKDT
jgi:hypothetical protein